MNIIGVSHTTSSEIQDYFEIEGREESFFKGKFHQLRLFSVDEQFKEFYIHKEETIKFVDEHVKSNDEERGKEYTVKLINLTGEGVLNFEGAEEHDVLVRKEGIGIDSLGYHVRGSEVYVYTSLDFDEKIYVFKEMEGLRGEVLDIFILDLKGDEIEEGESMTVNFSGELPTIKYETN